MATKKKQAPQEPTFLPWVVLIDGTNFHYCLISEFEAAKENTNYNWSFFNACATEQDCINAIEAEK